MNSRSLLGRSVGRMTDAVSPPVVQEERVALVVLVVQGALLEELAVPEVPEVPEVLQVVPGVPGVPGQPALQVGQQVRTTAVLQGAGIHPAVPRSVSGPSYRA